MKSKEPNLKYELKEDQLTLAGIPYPAHVFTCPDKPDYCYWVVIESTTKEEAQKEDQ